jgi:hypothetical protein
MQELGGHIGVDKGHINQDGFIVGTGFALIPQIWGIKAKPVPAMNPS